MIDQHREELHRILTEAGITGRLEGRDLYVTPAEFAKLNKWAGETYEYRSGDPEATINVVVEEMTEADRG